MNNDEKIKRIKDAFITLEIINAWNANVAFDTFNRMELYRIYLSYIYAITIGQSDEHIEEMKNYIDEWVKSLKENKNEN